MAFESMVLVMWNDEDQQIHIASYLKSYGILLYKKFGKLDVEIFGVYSSQSFEVKFLNRVATDLENLEKSGDLKKTSESQGICPRSQGICDRILKVRGKSEFFCPKFIFSQVEDSNFENFLGELMPPHPLNGLGLTGELNLISLITDWTVYMEKYKARGPDVQTDRREVYTKDRGIYIFRIDNPISY